VETITESAINQTNYESEFRVILPKQGLRWRHSNAKTRVAGRRQYAWHGIITDITERKQTEEALSHSHQLMNYIIEHNQSAVAVHDKNLNYVYVSQRYITITNKRKNIIGKHHYEFSPIFPKNGEKFIKKH
jgi:PAS domain-containing protein